MKIGYTVNNKILLGLLLSFWCSAVLVFFHYKSCSPNLRYTRVAEGNISQKIRGIWKSGMTSYIAILKDDADNAGRIRPVHWLYYNIPFFLTLVRNGDLFWAGDKVPIWQRINGDLQTHNLFLCASLAVTAGLISWMIWEATGSLLISLLFPLYFFQSPTICENLLVYYSDSQEIPQLLFLVCYLFFIRNIFYLRSPDWKQEILASIFLVLAYGTKETTIIILPVIGIVLLWQFIDQFKTNHTYNRFCLRHLGLNVFFAAGLLTMVWHFRSGAYVANNYIVNSSIIEKFNFAENIIKNNVPILQMLVVGGIFTTLYFLLSFKKYSFTKTKELVLLLLAMVVLFLGYFIINLPWDVKLIKYYLPVVFFGACSIVLLQALFFRVLSCQGLKIAAFIWIIGTSCFMLKDFNQQRMAIMHFYDANYGYRSSVPIISRDIASEANASKRHTKVLIIEYYKWHFMNGDLPFLRYVNHIYHINISNNGEMVHYIDNNERDYFRIFPKEPSVKISLQRMLPARLDFDEIYVLRGNIPNADKTLLDNQGYKATKFWNADTNEVDITRFSCNAQCPQ